jgi:Ser/Thr protein kinase RdoA (MazF antagonist)
VTDSNHKRDSSSTDDESLLFKMTPYSNLTPSLILDAIESVGFQCNGSLVSLNSYENRVYQVGIEDSQPLIAKFYRPHRWSDAAIVEEHAFSAELVDRDIPVIAPIQRSDNKTLHDYQGYRFALFLRQGGRTIELDNLEHLEWMGRFIGRLHAVGACRPFQHRIRLEVNTYGYQPYRYLMDNGFIPESIRQAFSHTLELLLEKSQQQFDRIDGVKWIRLHGDCHVGNILWNNEGPRIVDLDDCLMGPAIQDIWMLLTGDTEREIEVQLNHILRGYQEFHDFDYRELHLIEVLRSLRMIHYAGWLARRWEDPAFPLHFPWFNTLSYWKNQLEHFEDQVLILDELNAGAVSDDEDE